MIRIRTILAGWGGAPGLNTFYFLEDGTDPATVAEEAFARVHAFWEPVAAMHPTGFTATINQLVDEMDAATGDLIAGHPQTGTNVSAGATGGSNYLPAQTMAYIQFKTGVVVGQRRLRGGSYIGPMAAAQNGINGLISTSCQGTLMTAANALHGDLTSGGFQAVWHRPSGPAASDGEAHPVFDSYVGPVWSHLTSRRK